MKVVIADDSSLWRDRIKRMLNGNYNISVVGEAENGVEAMQLIQENEPDLVILDIRMPEMNGIEVLKKIRALKMETRVCILTNYPYPQYRKRCVEEGTDYFLSKTDDFEQIEIIVSDMLRNKLQDNKK